MEKREKGEKYRESLQVNIPKCYHFSDLGYFFFLLAIFSHFSIVNMEYNDAKHQSFNNA